ncbi:MAG TPA: Rieske 2Fe-2S domain-containing protein [Candidatus Limnocylindria bacterium]|nr:Rieske 2Fe-2S domain-containing protein [Candidatus Limnocylindria bacterium]
MRTLRDTPAAPPAIVRLILRAYPAAWRERYGAEVASLLALRPPSGRQLLDLLGGAFDARRHPDLLALPAGIGLAAAVPLRAPPASYGAVPSAPVGELSRRTFMRRAVGLGAGLLSLEFLGGTFAFLWPQIREGIGAQFRVGTLADILAEEPRFAEGWPFAYHPARLFLVNVPAATALALGSPTTVASPSADQILALWRKCPHLGCQVPALCDSVKRFHCRCHGSVYNILGEKLGNGPADRGMDRFPVTIGDDGVVVVDTSQRIMGPPARGIDGVSFRDAFPFEYTCDDA